MSPTSIWGRGDQTLIPVQVPKYTRGEAGVTSLSGSRVRAVALGGSFFFCFQGLFDLQSTTLISSKVCQPFPKV